MKRRDFLIMAPAILVPAVLIKPAQARAFPVKPVRLLLPFPAGSSTDVVARIVSVELGRKLGQPIVIENKVGAGGNIATEAAARAEPDGYTLLMGTVANAVSTAYYANLGYNLVKDFEPVTLTTTSPQAIVARADLPVQNMADFIAYAKRNPERVTYGSGGNGTAPHLAGALLNEMAGIRMTHVPYKGGVLALTDLLGGQIDVVISSFIDIVPHVKSGKLKGLGVTSMKRVSVLPDLPAVAETVPGFEAVGWHGMLAPAGTPAPIVQQLNAAVVEVLAMQTVKSALAKVGAISYGNSPQAFAEFIRSDIRRWDKAVALTGGKVSAS